MRLSPFLLASIGALLVASSTSGPNLANLEPSRTPPSGGEADDNLRAAILRYARGQIGATDPAVYWSEVLAPSGPYPPAWCGAFALWAIHQTGLPNLPKWEIGKGFCYKLPTTRTPKPADIAYFKRHQHHALVVGVENGILTTIDGNQPGITMRKRPVKDVAAFYSIAPLLGPHGVA